MATRSMPGRGLGAEAEGMSLIHVSSLTKSYAGRTVVDHVDLDVDAGEIVGILGPNGAGKSTLVECLGGLRRRDSGEVRVDGFDPDQDPPGLRAILGMQLQEASLPRKTTPREVLDLYRSFYAAPRDTDELLDRFGLSAQADRRFEVLSGGQQQRLSVALALVGNPRIAILDELTTGLDPAARREIWDFLAELRRDGLTIVLVTHFMEEAQHLCDRVAILDDGRVTAFGSPDALASTAGGLQRIRFSPSRPLRDEETVALLELPDISEVVVDGDRVSVTGGEDAVGAVVTHLVARGIAVRGLRVEAPNLDDAYLSLTASPARTKESS
ncbi:multidrug ABC transporter ATP-binding protein [Arsenicicoccus piscis]|uniref:Multidrug ABC transporter ATP-binding protein n=2 Tax=Arsenicicoccus piscis TaxID=673954 RepID=A0ABQ6HN00_9MICO|nr:multidrug ABC transporter ATP-binding protein [Arsenicicoccus piscis]